MQIGNVNTALSSVNAATPGTATSATSVAMLDNAIELNETMAQSTIKMMENSVTPYLGGNFDMSV